ncbi:MAG: hypothetical protein R2710_02970 [Acidimicrobiales bacterium]
MWIYLRVMGGGGTRLVKGVVSLDVALRFAAMVIAVSLLREFRQESESVEPNSDGFPVGLLIGPLAVFVVWNLVLMGVSIRRWSKGSLGEVGHVSLVGALSAARVLWMFPLADDLWYRHHDQLMVLVAASVLCTAGALVHRSQVQGDPSTLVA